MEYPHELLLSKAGIKIEDLSPDLQKAIKDFNERKSTDAKEELVDKLTANSNILAQNIYDYYVDPSSQEATIEIDADKKDITEAAQDILETKKEEEQEDLKGNGSEGSQPDLVENVQARKESATVPPKEEVVDPVAKAIEEGREKPAEPEKSKEVETPKETEDPSYQPTGDERVIHDLYSKGIKEKVSRDVLKKHGLNTGFWGNFEDWGGNYGRYSVRKTSNPDGTEKLYNISLRNKS